MCGHGSGRGVEIDAHCPYDADDREPRRVARDPDALAEALRESLPVFLRHHFVDEGDRICGSRIVGSV